MKNIAEQAIGQFLAFITEGLKITYNVVVTFAQPMKDATGALIERDPFAQVKELEVGSKTGFYVSCNVGKVSDWREAFALSAAKLRQRAVDGKKSGPVPEETKEEYRKLVEKVFPAGSPASDEIGESVAFLIAAAKDKPLGTMLRLTVKMADGLVLEKISVYRTNLGTIENLVLLADGGAIVEHVPGQKEPVPFDVAAYKVAMSAAA